MKKTHTINNVLKKHIQLAFLDRGIIGRHYYININYFMTTKGMKKLGILDLFEKGLLHTLINCPKTEYFKRKSKKRVKYNVDGKKLKKGGYLLATKKVIGYYRLYHAIKKNGLQVNGCQPHDFPSIFLAKDFDYPLDGAHRSSIAKKLSYRKIPAIIITPKDMLEIAGLPGELIAYLQNLQEPDLECFQATDKTNSYYKCEDNHL